MFNWKFWQRGKVIPKPVVSKLPPREDDDGLIRKKFYSNGNCYEMLYNDLGQAACNVMVLKNDLPVFSKFVQKKDIDGTEYDRPYDMAVGIAVDYVSNDMKNVENSYQ